MTVRLDIAKFETASQGIDGVEHLLLRSDLLRKLMRKALLPTQKAAKRFVPQPGYPGDKPGLKPLRDTIGSTVKQYDTVWVGIVEPKVPAGAHRHLVEFGHRMVNRDGEEVGFVEGREFMAAAIAATKDLAQAEFERSVVKEVERQWRT